MSEKNYKTLTNDNVVEKVISLSLEAFHNYNELPIIARTEVIKAIRAGLKDRALDIAKMELEETGMGKLQDKVEKILLSIMKTPGIEDLYTTTLSSDVSRTITEYLPYGVVCSVHPSNNPCATLINNCIGMLAAGNSIINIPHPRANECSKYVGDLINDIIYKTIRVNNLVKVLEQTNKSVAEEVMNHPDVDLVVTTGGRAMKSASLKTPKRVIAGGEANPVCIVDETADISRAVKCIVQGSSFDNNILCITEKNIVVVDKIKDEFINQLELNGVYYIDSDSECNVIRNIVLNDEEKMNRKFEGKSANEILDAAKVDRRRDYDLIVIKSKETSPLVTEELLLPVVPLVFVSDFEEALNVANFIEQGLKHTVIIHSQMISRLEKTDKRLRTSILVKNGSSLSAIGFNGDDMASFTIANVTGEGLTSAKDFARKRNCTIIESHI